MKTKRNLLMKLLCIFNCIALALVVQSANIACLWAFHQPEFPEAANRFKKIK